MSTIKGAIGKRFYWSPMRSFRIVRSVVFDGAEPGTLLLSSNGREYYVVSSSDRVVGRAAFVRGEYDVGKLELVLESLGKHFGRELIVDIGANIGTVCIPAVKRNLVKRAIAVEPEPFNFSLLVSNIHINGLADRITAHNLALGEDANDALEFELSESNFGDHRVRVTGRDGVFGEANRQTIHVRSEAFDVVVGEVNPESSLIWVDAQGFEGHVLRGATKALRSRPPIVMEFWPYGLERTNSFEPLKETIVSAGYSHYEDLSKPGEKGTVTSQSLEALFAAYKKGGQITDLLFT